MKQDCHIHMVLDGTDWKAAIGRHREGVAEAEVRTALALYRDLGYDYLRDGGDRWGVGLRARELAGEYGICYRTPLAPLHKVGHYGGFIGESFENLKEYGEKVKNIRQKGGDFVKIMISGLMDFDRFGVLTQPPLAASEIREMVHIAHEEGFSVMAHANSARTVEAAARAGADSVEHGAYLDEDALRAMVENGTVWVPTLSAVANLRGKGRFSEEAVQAIFRSGVENVRTFAEMGGTLACGSDAGAWAVPHGAETEWKLLTEAIGENAGAVLARGNGRIREKF